MGSVCCLLPYGSATDTLQLQLAEYKKRGSFSNFFEFFPPESIPGGFFLYVCAVERIMDVMKTANVKASQIIGFGSAAQLYISFQLGIADFLKTPWDFDELLARCERLLPATEYNFSWAKITQTGLSTSINGVRLSLPAGTNRLLLILARNAGQVLSRSSLLQLYGLSSGSRVIDNYVVSLRQVIGDCTGYRTGILESRYGQGYILSR